MDKLFALGGLMILACGGGSKAPSPDAASIAPVVCTATSTYAAASIVADGSAYAFTFAEITADGSNGLVDANQGFAGDLNADAMPDSFELDLYEGFGAFGSGDISKGSFTLSGDDLSFQKCGLCVQIYTDLDADGAPTDLYFATAGSVTLSAVGTPTGSDVSTGTLAGSLSNIAFAQWDGSGDAAIGSCRSSIASLSFSATIEPVADGFDDVPTRIVAHRTR
ncbi:MAG TPA: hypothetical protein VH143_18740 [Kofleriaceae bacterium]|jgi:hypothetical protein|nr:hypothetical protein [Kofleriaceae bacterium]